MDHCVYRMTALVQVVIEIEVRVGIDIEML